jgi:hypothetical protein
MKYCTQHNNYFLGDACPWCQFYENMAAPIGKALRFAKEWTVDGPEPTLTLCSHCGRPIPADGGHVVRGDEKAKGLERYYCDYDCAAEARELDRQHADYMRRNPELAAAQSAQRQADKAEVEAFLASLKQTP